MKNRCISQKAISQMAHTIGLPGNTKIYEVANAYAYYVGSNVVYKNNKSARVFLRGLKDSGIEVYGVSPFIPRNKTPEYLARKKEEKTSGIIFDKKFVCSKEFLKSYEWRSLRMKVLKKYGRKCACCGATPDNGVVMHVDHIKPRRKYPELALTEDNLQVLCEECNHGKGNWDETDWRNENDQTNQSQQTVFNGFRNGNEVLRISG